MHEVLRAAIAEVEQYSRVKVAPPVEGVLRGSAVSDVIHLVAELVENATKFSSPRTTTILRAQMVSAGVAIEVEDRGLGLAPADKHRMNALLIDPGMIEIDELLRDGRIGLYVVSMLARRHGIRVQLQNNIYGGTQAVVVLPESLLEVADGDRAPLPSQANGGGQPELVATMAPAPAAPMAAELTPAGTMAAEPTPAQPIAAWPMAAAADRPPLPKRPVQASIAPQERDERRDDSRRGQREQPAEQMPSLMADFLSGVSRSESEDPPAWDARD